MTRHLRHFIPVAGIVFLVLAAAAGAAESEGTQGVVNVNTADVEQLQLLPRIGPSLADRIIEFRKANGPFKSVDELVAVRGIGERSLEQLKPYVVVKGETTLDTKIRLPRRKPSAEGSR